jgi:hypothetical protein
MKQLISTKEVREAVNQNQHAIFLEKCHIITPAARDMAKELGVKFLEEDMEKPIDVDLKSQVDIDLKNPEIDIELICMIVIETLKQIRKRCDQ